jgi:predicted nucleic acid-binding protein
LLDTNIASFFLKRHPLSAAYRPHVAGHALAVAFMTEGEMREWALMAGWGAGRLARLNKALRSYLVIHSDAAVCHRWAEVRFQRRNQPIATADAWIAACALTHGLDLVTHNPADFRGISGLTLITEAP